MQLNGANYVPFTKGSIPGLFNMRFTYDEHRRDTI
jgi:hypothetical protein